MSVSPTLRRTQPLRQALAAAGVAIALLVQPLSAGAAAPQRHGVAAITPPPTIARAGKIVFCSDITYPPEEFYKSGNTAVGSDIDIATALATRMGVKAEFVNTGFNGIIAALDGNKCDAIISGMNDTADRRRKGHLSFVDYLNVGQSVMVQKGNPTHIHTLQDLSGKDVGVQNGTTNFDFLTAYNVKLKAQGKPTIKISIYQADTDGASALQANKLDAYATDSPVVAYYIQRNPEFFQFAVNSYNPIPIGIAVRNDEGALQSALQKALRSIYADGTMKKILVRWNMVKVALLLKM